MKKAIGLMVSALGVLVMSTACTAEMEAPEEVVAEADSALCSNKGGVNAVMSGLAVASGKELRRWLPMTDFTWNSSASRLELSSSGLARCGGACNNIQALLDMQNAPSGSVKFPGNITLDPALLRSELKKNWNEQVACVNNGRCPQETYDLKYMSWEFGSCDVKYFFNAYETGTTKRITDENKLNSLDDNMVFLGYPENRMLNFYLRDGQISVDPTGGLNEGGTTTSGSCTLACSKFSMSSSKDQCCSCNGSRRKFKTSPFSPYMFLCQ